MGQYFSPTFLDTTGRIIAALAPSDYGSGLKLSGHGRADTPLMWAVEAMLSLDGGLRLGWAGDYAPEETGADANLYFLAEERHFVRFHGLVLDDVEPTTALPTGFVTSDISHVYSLRLLPCLKLACCLREAVARLSKEHQNVLVVCCMP